MSFKEYLQTMVDHEASDLYLSTGAPPSMKVDGKMTPITEKALAPGEIKAQVYPLLDDEKIQEFEENLELNFAFADDACGRFRVNLFWQRHDVACVARSIKTEIPDSEQLGLPPILKQVIMEKRGLVLFVGATGSGKSTSLASLIEHRNQQAAGHIITIEDPIEFVYSHKKSIINQREVGVDTQSYQEALKNTLRQAPDVILIGEIRARETMEHAIAFAETGHLCISTLHANNANQALDRIINFFPKDQLNQLLLDLSLNMRAIVSQRLIPTAAGKRTAAVEILLNTPLVAETIKRGDVSQLKDLMEKSENLGMQTFDACLFKLFKAGTISYEDALKNADSKNNLRLRIQLEGGKPNQTSDMQLVQDEKPVSGRR